MISPKVPKGPVKPTRATLALLFARSGGVCEFCGRQPATEVHHRKFRSRGGGHNIENLLHLCGWGNHTGCHGLAHSGEPPAGLAVHAWEDERLVPVEDAGGTLWWLTKDGRRVLVDPDPEF